MPSVPIRRSPTQATQAASDATQIEAQFSHLTHQLETLKAQVRQAQQLAGLGTASAMIAHETSNLLTPILSYAEVALTGGDPALMKRALSVTLRNARILIHMSERMLEISSAGPTHRAPVSVRQAVEHALESLCRDLSKDGITLQISVDDALQVHADGLQLQQVLFNLLLNAREAMAPSHSGRLSISAAIEPGTDGTHPAADGRTIVVRIHNTGPAIPADILPHIFDALQTTKPADRNGRRRCGGLGLALCRDLVEENGGTISVTSDEAAGTTFVVTLPAAR